MLKKANYKSVTRSRSSLPSATAPSATSSRPIHLSIQKLKTGAVYLRWRKSGVKGQQPYLQLDSATGLQLLRAQSPAVRRQYFRFHQILIELNLSHSVCLAELRRLERYADQLKAFQGLKPVTGE
ncbi:hypothetical protein [Methylocaldum sp. GT1TLB]|uniref:hypothetical protein n=1 Tax=Methylocaldum sp. GT1TLB TaxID=3438965 RepID=UPI003DA06B70